MTNTFTPEHRTKLENYLATHELPSGLGSEESACSIAAINLAIRGELTDDIPDCMSMVLGRAAIVLQDAMPKEMRNSTRYKRLLPDMAGTGRRQEKERLNILLDWMWGVVLPQVQPVADKNGFGDEWRLMCAERTLNAAHAATAHARAAPNVAAYDASYAAVYAAYAARAARVAARDALAATNVARAAAYAASAARVAARDAARAANAVADTDDFWRTVDPIRVLERMTYLECEV